MDIAYCSATELIKKIQNREVGALELLEHIISRIEMLNASINAVVVTDFESTRIRAKAADEALDRGEVWGPLHGLPITIKEAIAVAGLPLTAGSPAMAGNNPGCHADVVQSLVDAGVVILGKTNMPVFGMDFQSYNDVYGQTNNPWDLTLTPGGSSGGAAAALAAGMTALEIGSDFGGSIRLPAGFCGLYGHKSTFNIVPLAGHTPELTDILVAGPLARSAGDLDMVIQLITRPEKSRRTAWQVNLPAPRKESLRDYRVGLWLDDPACPVDEAVGKRLQIFVDRLIGAGVNVSDRRPDIEFAKGLEVNNERRNFVDTLQSWAGLTGVVYLPATVAPVGLTDDGLPVGVQIVGPYLEDRTTIHFAELVEEIFGGFVPPPAL